MSAPRQLTAELTALAISAFLFHPALIKAASPYIEIRIAVKLIDYNGQHNAGTEAQFDALLQQANHVMDVHQRGLHFVKANFRTITPNVPAPPRYFSQATGDPVPNPPPGQPDPPNTFKIQPVNFFQFWNPTHGEAPDACWPAPDALTAANGTVINPMDVIVDDIFKTAIRDNPGPDAFDYQTTSANLYVIFENYCGGEGTFPGTSHADSNIYLVSGVTSLDVFLHEFGHYVDLPHPFSTVAKDVISHEDPDYTDTPDDAGDLNVPDNPSSPANGESLALKLYGQSYAMLNDNAKVQVRIMDRIAALRNISGTYSSDTINELWRTWEMIMSYHKGQDANLDNWLYSEQHLDHMTDIMNNVRRPIMSGRTWFVTPGGIDAANAPNGSNSVPYNNPAPPGQSFGVPYSLRLSLSLVNPAGGDIILLRPADVFPVTGTINERVTLRVSRGGHATIGSATAH